MQSGVLCTLVLLVVALCSPGEACVAGEASTGVVQLQNMYESCPPGDANGRLGACGIAFEVTVDQKGTISLTPLVEGNITSTGPGPSTPTTFECSALNGTGRVDGSNQSAQITFFNDFQGPPYVLSVVNGSLLRVEGGRAFSYKAPPPNCTYTYKVVSGCVLGVSAPPTPPACPQGTYLSKGVGGASYCAPCPAGQYSSSDNSPSCSPCPAGTEKPYPGGFCTPCTPTYYAEQPGSSRCSYCGGDSNYTDGVSCKPCPADSWPVAPQRTECAVCNGRKRCCRANPSASCPACPEGFKSGVKVSALYMLEAAYPSRCFKESPAVCTTSFTIAITPQCTLQWTASSTQNSNVAFCYSSQTESSIKGPELDTKRDFTQFLSYTDFSTVAANVTGISAPFINFTFDPLKCTYRYRAINGRAAQLLGAPPKACPFGTPGCPFKLSIASINATTNTTTKATTNATTNATKAPRPQCPPGKYLVKRVCIPCPPGAVSSRNSSRPCRLCAQGKFAAGYGNTRCRMCRGGSYAAAGSNECVKCVAGSYALAGSASCSACPTGTSSAQGRSSCLGNNVGSVCCGAGKCLGAACPSGLVDDPDSFPAVLKLESKNLTAAACKSVGFLNCMGKGALLAATSRDAAGTGLQLTPVDQPKCTVDNFPTLLFDLVATYTSPRSAVGQVFSGSSSDEIYTLEAYTAANKSMVKITLKPPTASAPPLCSAAFELVAGAVFDFNPPVNATCPSASVTSVQQNRTFCTFCKAGSRLKNGQCVACSPGTYQNLVGTSACRPCRAGTFSSASSSECSKCSPGTFSKKGSAECSPCAGGTFSGEAASKCSGCPEGYTSVQGSSACTVPV